MENKEIEKEQRDYLEIFFERLLRGELMEMTLDERDNLYKRMSEEDVVRYYQTVDQLEDEDRGKILEKWIPRPKILYHASHLDNIEVFEPSEKSKRSKDEPLLVFSSPLKSISSVFVLENSNSYTFGSYDGGLTWILVDESIDSLRKRNRPGFIYSLPTDSFGVKPDLGLKLYEWTSEKPVYPLRREKINSAFETILELGVQIYVPSPEISMEEFKNGDQAALIEKMRRVTIEDF